MWRNSQKSGFLNLDNAEILHLSRTTEKQHLVVEAVCMYQKLCRAKYSLIRTSKIGLGMFYQISSPGTWHMPSLLESIFEIYEPIDSSPAPEVFLSKKKGHIQM